MPPPPKRSPGRSGAAWRKVSALVRARATHCWLCRKPLQPQLRWPHPRSTSVHHVIPLSAGGPPLDPRNLVGTHLECNLQVGDRIVAEGALAEPAAGGAQRGRLNPSRVW